jgi:hypothetical protein
MALVEGVVPTVREDRGVLLRAVEARHTGEDMCVTPLNMAVVQMLWSELHVIDNHHLARLKLDMVEVHLQDRRHAKRTFIVSESQTARPTGCKDVHY